MRVKTKAAAVVAVAGLALGGIAAAAPAQAAAGYRMDLQTNASNAGGIGVSTLNGWTFTQAPGTSRTAQTYSSPWSLRAVHTAPGWCVGENSQYLDRDGSWVNLGFTTHPYTAANGGWRTLSAATYSANSAGQATTRTALRLDPC